ncbi:MAG: YdeI/OmpD-associated family protein [Bacteroidota bacterium]
MLSFNAKIFIIGINPYVLLPAAVLKEIFKQAGKDKSAIPVKGTINQHSFTQTLVKYSGKWRLYINGPMLKGSNTKLGDTVTINLEFDAADRTTPMHPKLKLALQKNKQANEIFKKLSPSGQKEIMRYINNLKSESAIDNNVKKAIQFLLGRQRFIGRDKP